MPLFSAILFLFGDWVMQPELRDMAGETLEEELQALMSDKCGETEYQESLQNQIGNIKVNMPLTFSWLEHIQQIFQNF